MVKREQYHDWPMNHQPREKGKDKEIGKRGG